MPDPGSRFQPDDVLGPSEVVDPAAFAWEDAGWTGRPWHEAVIYELHVGTFTQEGTFRAVIDRLDHLVRLGVTAIELMPVGEFGGTRNWGYDGVLPYAPDAAYGRPEDLKALIAAAHARGLMVLLDVIYNHFGPEGNFLPLYAPAFTPRHKTPWGDGIDYDGPSSRPMRDFVVHNVLYWLEEFHFDGLRLDAVHGIIDDSPVHLLDEIATRVAAMADGRQIHLVLENEENDPALLARDAGGLPRRYTAQWNDDVHHVLHTAATGESAGYYADYIGRSDLLGRALAEGFAFQGEEMPYRGAPRGEASGHLPPTAFVAFLQNHDQIGNRAFGDRITKATPPEPVRAAAAAYLLSPQIPMLFMGEEWAASTPFPFFVGFSGDLADAVREGRRSEFARFPEFRDPEQRETIPDPVAETTFRSAVLDWAETIREPHAGWLAWYNRILDARQRHVTPLLADLAGGDSQFEVIAPGGVAVRWRLAGGAMLHLHANLTGETMDGFPEAPGRSIWIEGREGASAGELGRWSVRWSVEN
ncbi:Malto-oligosyltrehalose trehalohydrolase [Methylobrevis pamukkalensis]|uniref:Malto-oligosyltrehalose trehalohydrolase n=1 Tax=Methylobrevis pamukkalensis TaxID=1439726 RepID=A0A1E3GY02_9HYPH|nr:Malto-oligosyltrehalose trehalohydrolase [Methylobrevis pamukkalensis]